MTDVPTSTPVNTDTQVQVMAAGKKGTTKMDKKKSTDRPKPTHPTTAVMVNNAIQNLKERGGSSLQAIKKYISATYKIDGEKFSPFIKKYLKASVAAGTLVQTKGKGASGSFKLATSAVTKKPKTIATTTAAATTVSKPKKVAVKPAAKPKKVITEKKKTEVVKKSAPVKTAKTKKTAAAAAVVEKKKPVVEAATAVAKSKSPSKVKKTAKAPTKKPKSPKPKTTKSKVTKKKAAAAAASPKKK